MNYWHRQRLLLSAPMYLDEYKITSEGKLDFIQSLPMPLKKDGMNNRITGIPRSSYSGTMSLSNDSQYLVFYGYDAERGTSLQTINTDVNPIVYARVGSDGKVDTQTLSTSYNNEIRGIASYDGSGFYIAGNGNKGGLGLDYAPYKKDSQTSLMSAADMTSIGGPRTIIFQAGKLCLISWAHTFEVENESWPPIAESTYRNIIPRPAEGGTSYSSCIIDLDSSNPGTKLVMYQPNDNAGLFKYSLIDGVWVSNGKCLTSIASSSTLLKSITGRVVDGNIELYIVENHQWGGRLLSVVDKAGFNGTIDSELDTSIRVLKDFTGSAYAIRSVAWSPRKK